jgi:hypothetical protein
MADIHGASSKGHDGNVARRLQLQFHQSSGGTFGQNVVRGEQRRWTRALTKDGVSVFQSRVSRERPTSDQRFVECDAVRSKCAAITLQPGLSRRHTLSQRARFRGFASTVGRISALKRASHRPRFEVS